MSFLDSLTPAQRTALAVGIPVVGGAVIISTMRKPAEPEPAPDEAAPPAGTIPGYDMPSTDAIGTGTIAQLTTMFTDAYEGMSERIGQLETSQANAPKPLPKLTVLSTVAKPGETANDVAIRLRAGGAKTYDGRALTADWIIRFNQIKVNGRYASPTAKLWPGMPIRY
jgi:hypothetical protein